MSVLEQVAAEYEAKIDENKAHIERLYALAREESRDLTAEEDAVIDRLGEANDQLKIKIERAVKDYGVDDDIRAKIRTVTSGPVQIYRSAGELLWDMLHGRDDPDARNRYARFQRSIDQARQPMRIKRAAEHLGLDKANTEEVAGGFNGLIVMPNVGPVLDPSPRGAPLFNSLSPIPATSASFQRPRIVDENFDDSISDDIKEKAEGPSKAWDIVAEPLTLAMKRGYINVSELLLEMVAASLDMVVGHMNRRLEWRIERSAAAAVSSTTKSIPLAADADSIAFQAALGQAMVAVFQATGEWPTWIAFGPTGAGRIIALTDLAGRPLYPNIGPANALGTGGYTGPPSSVGGLVPVPTPAITDASLYIGNSASLEAYLRRFPIMQALEPALFGRQIGVAAAVQFYNPITTEAVEDPPAAAKREGVVKIAWAA